MEIKQTLKLELVEVDIHIHCMYYCACCMLVYKCAKKNVGIKIIQVLREVKAN